MFIPIKIDKLMVNVTIKWLVNVKLYGINPIKFKDNKKKKIENTNGKKYWLFLFLIFSVTSDKIILCIISIIDCQRFGTIKYVLSLVLIKLKNKTNVKKAINNSMITSFVKLKSKKPKYNDISGNTWNCSKGLVNSGMF